MTGPVVDLCFLAAHPSPLLLEIMSVWGATPHSATVQGLAWLASHPALSPWQAGIRWADQTLRCAGDRDRLANGR